MEEIKHLTKGQSDWQTTVNQLIDGLTEIGGDTKLQLSAPSRDGIVLLDGTQYNDGESSTYYQTASFKNFTLVIFTFSVTSRLNVCLSNLGLYILLFSFLLFTRLIFSPHQGLHSHH